MPISANESLRQRTNMACEPIRMRATITIDIEVENYLDAQQAKASIETQFTEIRQSHKDASLNFKQRRLRRRPRPGAPGPVIMPYADD